MELEGVVHNGVVVLDDGTALAEGTRVRVEAVFPKDEPTPKTFGERYGDLIVDSLDAPVDLASQHDHYRLGTPKR